VLDYPHSGERIRHKIQVSRTVQPNKKRFTVRRIIGSGNLWITEFVLTYDGIFSRIGSPLHPWRVHLVERMDEITSRFHRTYNLTCAGR
jgi:hypothetical protein